MEPDSNNALCAEIERLEAVNAELLAALEKIVDHNPSTCPGIMPQDCLETCQEIARAAIAKAKEKK